MTVRLAAVAGLGSRPVSSSSEHVLSPLSRPPLKEKQRKSFIHSFIHLFSLQIFTDHMLEKFLIRP